MKSTKEEIALLLDFAFNSGLTAQEIIDKVSGVSDHVVVSNITLKELFSFDNIKKVCGDGCDEKLINRIINSLFFYEGYNKWDPEVLGLPVKEAIYHKNFRPVKKWKNCGKQSWPIIYKMFESVKVEVL